MLRIFRLTNESGGLGLSCTAAGLSLAGVPLLQKTEAGFVPRRAPDIAALINAAYGADTTRLQSSVEAIAQALNRGDLARAMITAVLTRTPELSSKAAAGLATVEKILTKYNRDEPRDWHGRWTRDGAVGPANRESPAHVGTAIQVADASGLRVSNSEQDDGADNNEPRESTSLEQEFERDYDELGPVEFAKRVIQFGSWIERTHGNLSPADKERALAEYAFLQDRLSTWLAYEYKPPVAHANLISAAMTLFQGATNSGLVRPRELPRSMLYVGAAAWAFDNVPPRGPSTKPGVEEPPPVPILIPKEIEGVGNIADNSEVKVVWGKGIEAQGIPWEDYYEKRNTNATRLPKGSKGFDHFDESTNEAVSNKTLDTLTMYYIKKPQKVYEQVKRYVDKASNYEPYWDTDLDPMRIESKTLHLAIPEYTSPTQWHHLFRSIIYGKEKGVRVVITRIRE